MSWKSFVGSLTAGVPHSDKRFRGLKIALIGFFVTLGGLLVFLGGFNHGGTLIIYCGIAVGFIGIATHVVTMFREWVAKK
jgi:hypothetical protein